MRTTNNTGLPEPLVAALRDDGYTRGVADISATGLLSPPRQQALNELHADELEEDAADLAAILIGKAVHEKIALKATGELSDKLRMYMQVEGWVVSGQTDHVGDEMFTDDGGVIYDYKTTNVNEWKYGLKEERAQQLNIYAELLRVNGYSVTGLAAVLVFKDWSAPQARFGGASYPPHSIVEMEVPLWPREQAQAFILERVLAHQAARRGLECEQLHSRHEHYGEANRPDGVCLDTLPLCTDEERWMRGAAWAVMRGANKTSTKNFDNEADAVAFAAEKGTDYRVETRAGTFTRCTFYCAAGRGGFCEQWNGERAAGEG